MKHMTLGLALKTGLKAGIVAAILNLIVFEIAHVLLRMSFLVPQGTSGRMASISAVMVILACMVPGIVGAVLFWILVKLTRHGVRIFSVIAYLFLGGSFYGVFSQVQYTAEGVVLSLMHLIAASLIIRRLKKVYREGVTTSEPAQTIQPMVS